ncbi:hypothetical protein [Pontibaca methylaminivorans]|uniref:hypothetical protein n=1 Tax=Pontibaca methylaminivorans TaxID=515897 RepID=UPI001F37473C|nr:hypothetical protein [Pontibaca methylaminivorans]
MALLVLAGTAEAQSTTGTREALTLDTIDIEGLAPDADDSGRSGVRPKTATIGLSGGGRFRTRHIRSTQSTAG